MEVEIGNPSVLDYGFGWRWRWLGLVGEGWVFLGLVEMEIGGRGGCFCWRGLGFSGFGQGGDRWSGWSWVWSGWRSVVGVVVFVGEVWVFLGLVRVEIGGRGGRFCWRGLGFSGFDWGGDRWSFLYCLVDRDSDWASTKWIRCC